MTWGCLMGHLWRPYTVGLPTVCVRCGKVEDWKGSGLDPENGTASQPQTLLEAKTK